MIIVTFSDPEEQVVEKIKAVLAEDQETECIPIAEGKMLECMVSAGNNQILL